MKASKCNNYRTDPFPFYVQPVINNDVVGPNGATWFLGQASQAGFGQEDVTYGRLQWVNGSATQPTWTVLEVTNKFGDVLGAPQPVSQYKIYAPRVGTQFTTAAVLRNNALWACRCIGVNASGGDQGVDRDACEWLQFNVQGQSLSFGSSGRVFDQNATKWFYYFPSIMVNARGDVLMGFSGSSASDYVGAFYSARLLGQSTFGSVRTLRVGEAPMEISDPNNPPLTTRWGDYSNVALDPNDSTTFWTIQERAKLQYTTWSTMVGAISPY